MTKYSVECHWCSAPIEIKESPLLLGSKLAKMHCPECGAPLRPDTLNWERIEEVFKGKIPLCGCHDAEVLNTVGDEG